MKKLKFLLSLFVIMLCIFVGTTVNAASEPQTMTSVSNYGTTFTVSGDNLDVGCTVIVALYKDEKLVETQSKVYASSDLRFTTDKEYDLIKVMVWEDLNDLSPVTTPEEITSVTGKIFGIDSEKNILYIEGVEYPYNETAGSVIEWHTNIFDVEVKLYINSRGVICGAEILPFDINYGFLTIAMESTTITGNTMEVRMMDTDGKWDTYTLAKDFEINGYDGTISDFKVNGNLVFGKYVYNQVVGYKLNDAGEIASIYTSYVNDEFEIGHMPSSPVAYNGKAEMYNGMMLTEDTVIFNVPSGTDNTAIIEEDCVEIVTKDILVDREVYIMTAYNVNHEGEVPILLGYDITGRINWASDFMVITNKVTRTNADGVVGVQITGLVGGEEVTFFASTEAGEAAPVYETEVTDGVIGEGSTLGRANILDKGDVIFYSLNSKGEAAKIVRIQDATTIETAFACETLFKSSIQLGSVASAGKQCEYYLGYVSEANSSRIAIQNDMTEEAYDERTYFALNTNATITEVNTKHPAGTKVSAGNTDSIVADSELSLGFADELDGDIVLIKTEDGVMVDVVVYANVRPTKVIAGEATAELTFATEDINEAATELTYGELVIFTDETKELSKIYNIDIEKVYLNGMENDTLKTSLAFLSCTAEADVRLVDNDGDGAYEEAYVTAYVDYVVEAVSARNYRIIGSYAPSHYLLGTWPQRLILDEENEEYTFEIIKDGEVVDFSAIQEGDILSIAGGYTTNDLTYGTVTISRQTVTGTIDGFDTSKSIVYVDGVEYPYNEAIGYDLYLGTEAIFYINSRGVIVGLNAIQNELNYGFVTVAMETSSITGNTMELRMMDTDGQWNTYVLAKEFDLDGAYGTHANFKALGDNSVYAGKYVYNTLVAYELNEDGEIDNIYVTPGYYDEAFTSDGNTYDRTYNATTGIYNGKMLTEDTVIFNLPMMPSTTLVIDEDDVEIVAKDVLVDRANYTMTAYNTNEDGEVPVLVGYGITGRINWASDFMVITNKVTRTNADGEVGVQITGLVGGEEVTFFASTEGTKNIVSAMTSDGIYIEEGIPSAEATILSKGDVILYSLDAKGEAVKIIRIQDAATIDAHLDSIWWSTPTFNTNAVRIGTRDVAGMTYTYYLGYVNEVRPTRITIQEDMSASPSDEITLVIAEDSVVTEIDTNHATGVKVSVGDTGNILCDSGLMMGAPDYDGDIVFIKAINDVIIVEAVVYHNF